MPRKFRFGLLGAIGLPVVFFFQNCGPSFESMEIASLQEVKCKDVDCTEMEVAALPVDCIFNGQKVADGSGIIAYLESSATTCTSEIRTCSKGELSGSYLYASCSVASKKSCLFNGKTIPHSGSVKAYKNSSVPNSGNCEEETRICNDGALSGSFRYAACSKNAPKSCLFDGKTVPHNGLVKAYLTSSVPSGQTCQSQNRICVDGKLSGNYTFGSCVVNAPASCTFNGQTIPHNGSVTAYLASSVSYGKTCTSQSRKCTNGSLSGSYTFGSCTIAKPSSLYIENNQNCSSNENGIVEHWESHDPNVPSQKIPRCWPKYTDQVLETFTTSCPTGQIGQITKQKVKTDRVSDPNWITTAIVKSTCRLPGEKLLSWKQTIVAPEVHRTAIGAPITIVFGIAADSNLTTIALRGNSHGVPVSNNGGKTWKMNASIEDGKPIYAMSPLNPIPISGARDAVVSANGQTIVVGMTYNPSVPSFIELSGYTGRVMISHDSGKSWFNAPIPKRHQWSKVAVSGDGQVMAAIGTNGDWSNPSVSLEYGYLYTSRDGGHTWKEHQELGRLNATDRGIAISQDGQKILFYAISPVPGQPKFLSSTNKGLTFTELSSRPVLNFSASHDLQTLMGYAGGQNYLSIDGGTTWKTLPLGRSLSPAVSGDGKTLMGVGSNDSPVFISRDQGQSWQMIPLPPEIGPLDIKASYDGKSFLVSARAAVFKFEQE